MRKSIGLPLILGFSLVCAGVVACGDSTGSESADDETGDGDGDPTTGDGDPTTGDGDPTTGDGDPTTGDGDPTTGDGDPTTGDGDPSGDCQVWEIVYDLTNSEFEISGTTGGLGDQVNVVAEPYTNNDRIGPGHFVLRFADVDGEPGGQAFMHTYEMSLHFVVSPTGATVATDLETEAGPVDCGITSGTIDGTNLAWSPSAIVDLHSEGQILCTGIFCGAGGLPNGEVVPVDEVEDQPLSAFVFSDELDSFTMAKTVIQQDNNSTTTWMYVGTEVSRELVDAPACLCE